MIKKKTVVKYLEAVKEFCGSRDCDKKKCPCKECEEKGKGMEE